MTVTQHTSYFLFLAGAFLSSPLMAESESNDWSARSKQTQFQQSSDYAYKQSKVTSAKSANNPPNQNGKLGQPARTLSVRPSAKSSDHEFWIYDAWVTLHSDLDYDGYYSHFSLEFDADTYYDYAQVYARLYLSKGDVFKEYHTTSVFSIQGEDSSDSLIVESELVNGFQPADYEILIELYDTDTDEIVAIYDGYSDEELYLLPLESEDYEDVYVDDRVIVTHEHAGALGWLSVSLAALIWFRRRGRRSSQH